MEHEYVREWFDYADTDLASAEYLCGMHPKPLEIICYHCQQSAEKNLKGYLIFNGIAEPPKIRQIQDFEPLKNVRLLTCGINKEAELE